jgi:Uma2 family endonuclease
MEAWRMALPDLRPENDSDLDEVEAHAWTRKEYEQAAEAGVFGDRRVELIDGTVFDIMAPQKSSHATGVHKGLRALSAAFPAGWTIRCQSPLALGVRSMPEPDLAVVAGEPDDYADHHPAAAALIVEVADSSQLHDRKRKARIYAAAGIPDYWIMNLRRDVIEVFRDPAKNVYRWRKNFRRGDVISPVVLPEVSVAVDDLLPRLTASS